MTHETTLKLFTNLDRSAIEAKLRDLKDQAASRDVPNVAALLEGAEGKGREELEGIVGACLDIVRALPGSQRLVAEFEMVQLNLANIR